MKKSRLIYRFNEFCFEINSELLVGRQLDDVILCLANLRHDASY